MTNRQRTQEVKKNLKHANILNTRATQRILHIHVTEASSATWKYTLSDIGYNQSRVGFIKSCVVLTIYQLGFSIS